jgi:hypothetical protein
MIAPMITPPANAISTSIAVIAAHLPKRSTI